MIRPPKQKIIPKSADKTILFENLLVKSILQEAGTDKSEITRIIPAILMRTTTVREIITIRR